MLTAKAFDQLAIVAQLTYLNPFTEERIELEKQLLGSAYPGGSNPWNVLANKENISVIDHTVELADTHLRQLRESMAHGATLPDKHLKTVRDASLFVLYHHTLASFQELTATAGKPTTRFKGYDRFAYDVEVAMAPLRNKLDDLILAPAHILACFFQVWRAYTHISRHLVGTSISATRLRARIWQSIFTHDAERYQRCLFDKLGDITTLITGPSGSGKELVARAIGLSRYIPFDADKQCFADHFASVFFPINLSALSPTIIESELFGHKRSAFTGALQDHAGYLETCGSNGAVFLDEIGEASPEVQVKLLRVLQTRGFQRLGDTQLKSFEGKVIAATNRDLPVEIERGTFREDLYYRLCADRIETPSLSDIIGRDARQLRELIDFIADKLVGSVEAPALANDAELRIQSNLGLDYPWPGNFRELEQAMRNILVHGDYRPTVSAGRGGATGLEHALKVGELTAKELLQLYVAQVYRTNPNYEAVARQLDLDRRTVKKYVQEVAEQNSEKVR